MPVAYLARRIAIAALLLVVGALIPAPAQTQDFEIEDSARFAGTGDTVLRIISTADLDVFTPYIARFQAAHPEITVDYVVTASTELGRAIRDGAAFDVAISSAMDLQFLLANDGFARRHVSGATESLPDWARWRDMLFAFAAEPAVVVISREAFAGRERPRTRQALIAMLRGSPEAFDGAVGTYDVRQSGLGYLFATQEARSSDAYWRLGEIMGRLNVRLYCCSSDMIDAIADGRLALAYNVLGSYATERLQSDDRLEILVLEDYANVMLRTAFIPTAAVAPDAAGLFVDALVQAGLRAELEEMSLPPLRSAGEGDLGPIRLGPALMVYLDPLTREAFLSQWSDAMVSQ